MPSKSPLHLHEAGLAGDDVAGEGYQLGLPSVAGDIVQLGELVTEFAEEGPFDAGAFLVQGIVVRIGQTGDAVLDVFL